MKRCSRYASGVVLPFSPIRLTYPSRTHKKLIISKGGRLVLSDDSHGPRAVGLNYDRKYAYLVKMGVEEVWYLERCEEVNAGGRQVRARKVEADWREDAFWARNGVAVGGDAGDLKS